MFGWLANLLVKIPIQGNGCACCEAKKEQLRQMQKEIFDIEENQSNTNSCICDKNFKSEKITISYRYKL